MYIICPLVEHYKDTYFNSGVLIGRKGEIVGKYHKYYPTIWEIESGITPGTEFTVLETDFGKVGMAICFDLNFFDVAVGLAQNGAEIVFWASAYDGGKHLSIRPWNHRYYIVSAVNCDYARIVDTMGDVRAMTGPRDPVVAETIDLDVGLFCTDFNSPQIPLMRSRYGPDLTIKTWHEEGFFTVQTNRDDLSVADIMEEFLLDPLDEFLARNERLQAAWRKGEPVPDLTPPYVGRTQWEYWPEGSAVPDSAAHG